MRSLSSNDLVRVPRYACFVTSEERVEDFVDDVVDDLDDVVDDAEPAADAVRGAAPVDGSDIPDLALRSALEFAVGIAAAGQKLRPPLAYPAGLKSLLKFNHLDRTALRVARRAVAGDDIYRERLAVAATSDMVDDIGLLWLNRPEGWIEQIHELQAQARQAATIAKDDAALRKSERRREAAEQAALRAQAELVGHHDALAREQMRRERAEEMATTARREAAATRTELSRLQAEINSLRSRLGAEQRRSERAEQAVTALTDRLGEAEKVRDEALAKRSGTWPNPGESMPSSAANADAADALRTASRATRALADALAAASDAMSESGSAEGRLPPRATRPRHERRRPIAIPGGLYGDSVAALEHVLRTPNARIVVDGYNLAKTAWPARELIDQRESCIAVLEDWVRRTAADVHVIFDGADVVGASGARRLVRVQYSPAGVTADDVIRSEVAALPASTPVVVVTNDQAIVNDVRAAGANTVPSDQFLHIIGVTAPATRPR
jgi:predicted RNA-binding protein with PIN domain